MMMLNSSRGATVASRSQAVSGLALPSPVLALRSTPGLNQANPHPLSVRCDASAEPGGRSRPPVGTVGREKGSMMLEFDPIQYLYYGGAITVQVGIMTGALWVLQQVADSLASGSIPLPVEGDDAAKAVVTLFWLVVSIKSRIFSPLDATRPKLSDESKAKSERRRPDWCPPPITFPIVWTTIGLLRAASSVMVWEACGRDLISLPLVTMCLHLAIGDAWNNVNVTRQELGMAVPGVFLGCLGSCILVTATYYMADPQAGMILSPSCLWLTVASFLVLSIWSLNEDENGYRMPIIPTKKVWVEQ